MTPHEPETFLSGASGTRTGVRKLVTGGAADLALDALQALTGTNRMLDRLAAAEPARTVLVLAAYRPGGLLHRALPELSSKRHAVTLAFGAVAAADPALDQATLAVGLSSGKFDNLNRLLQEVPPPVMFDWTLVVDDDVLLPARFLDRFVALAGALSLDLAQPAQTLRSHAAWHITRRRPASVARRTRFVEIGPVTAFRSTVSEELLPFPPLRFGWGLDLHWATLAEERSWRLGIVDALPVRHERTAVASSYDRTAAVDEARRFLTTRRYLASAAAQETLFTYRRVPLRRVEERG